MADASQCRKCGRCCYAKLILDGEVVYTPFPCSHLDEETRLCTIYERRHELNPQCLAVEVGIRLGVFPADCPYVRGLPDYVPPRRLTRRELKELGQEILEAQQTVRDPAADKNQRRPSRTAADTQREEAGDRVGEAHADPSRQ